VENLPPLRRWSLKSAFVRDSLLCLAAILLPNLPILLPNLPILLARHEVGLHAARFNLDYLLVLSIYLAAGRVLAMVAFLAVYLAEFVRIFDGIYFFSQKDIFCPAIYGIHQTGWSPRMDLAGCCGLRPLRRVLA